MYQSTTPIRKFWTRRSHYTPEGQLPHRPHFEGGIVIDHPQSKAEVVVSESLQITVAASSTSNLGSFSVHFCCLSPALSILLATVPWEIMEPHQHQLVIPFVHRNKRAAVSTKLIRYSAGTLPLAIAYMCLVLQRESKKKRHHCPVQWPLFDAEVLPTGERSSSLPCLYALRVQRYSCDSLSIWAAWRQACAAAYVCFCGTSELTLNLFFFSHADLRSPHCRYSVAHVNSGAYHGYRTIIEGDDKYLSMGTQDRVLNVRGSAKR